ncbi:MAG: methylmalonyl-CoA epimerase [Planctomycetes bacterium]|nr:methylmalonyl-CoA epimerase [Planctomycetota bacterium]
MRLDHIGIAVKSIAASRKFYEGGLKLRAFPQVEEVAGEKVKVLKLDLEPGLHIELLEATSPDSAVAKFIEKRGEGMHHLCYAVDDVVAATHELEMRGFVPIWAEPHVGAGGCLVNFFHPKETFGVLTELSQPPVSGN